MPSTPPMMIIIGSPFPVSAGRKPRVPRIKKMISEPAITTGDVLNSLTNSRLEPLCLLLIGRTSSLACATSSAGERTPFKPCVRFSRIGLPMVSRTGALRTPQVTDRSAQAVGSQVSEELGCPYGGFPRPEISPFPPRHEAGPGDCLAAVHSGFRSPRTLSVYAHRGCWGGNRFRPCPRAYIQSRHDQSRGPSLPPRSVPRPSSDGRGLRREMSGSAPTFQV